MKNKTTVFKKILVIFSSILAVLLIISVILHFMNPYKQIIVRESSGCFGSPIDRVYTSGPFICGIYSHNEFHKTFSSPVVIYDLLGVMISSMNPEEVENIDSSFSTAPITNITLIRKDGTEVNIIAYVSDQTEARIISGRIRDLMKIVPLLNGKELTCK